MMKSDKGTPLIFQAAGVPSKGADHLLQGNSSMKRSRFGRESCAICDQLVMTTEYIRQQLVQLVMERGSFLSEDVIELSQWLDQYIVAVQYHAKKERLCGR